MNSATIGRGMVNLLVVRRLVGVIALVSMAVTLNAADPADLPAVNDIDHAGILRSWNAGSFTRGEKLYNGICITCHGNLTQAGSLPFLNGSFQNGREVGSEPACVKLPWQVMQMPL